MSSILSVLALFIKDTLFFVSYVKNKTFPHPLPKKEEEKYIHEMVSGDENARNKLIEHNLRLVAHIVKKFDNTGEDDDDLISIGTIGLIKGVKSFTPNKGTKLATYCARCIENEILMHLRSIKKKKRDMYLEDPIGHDKEGNEINLLDILESDNEHVIDYIQLNMDIILIKQYLNILSKREKMVITDRYGLNQTEEQTQKEIARKLNISRSYVSRIEKRALTKICHAYYRDIKTR